MAASSTSLDAASLDISLSGSCRSDILYHCSHLLSEHQRTVILDTEGKKGGKRGGGKPKKVPQKQHAAAGIGSETSSSSASDGGAGAAHTGAAGTAAASGAAGAGTAQQGSAGSSKMEAAADAATADKAVEPSSDDEGAATTTSGGAATASKQQQAAAAAAAARTEGSAAADKASEQQGTGKELVGGETAGTAARAGAGVEQQGAAGASSGVANGKQRLRSKSSAAGGALPTDGVVATGAAGASVGGSRGEADAVGLQQSGAGTSAADAPKSVVVGQGLGKSSDESLADVLSMVASGSSAIGAAAAKDGSKVGGVDEGQLRAGLAAVASTDKAGASTDKTAVSQRGRAQEVDGALTALAAADAVSSATDRQSSLKKAQGTSTTGIAGTGATSAAGAGVSRAGADGGNDGGLLPRATDNVIGNRLGIDDVTMDVGEDVATARRLHAAWERATLAGAASSTSGGSGSRHMNAGGLMHGDAHKHELQQLAQQQQAVSLVLSRFGLNPGMPVAALAAANAPFARCLRRALQEGELSISPDAPQVSDTCRADVRAFFVQRASDVRHDLPLLAACASDINKACSNITDPASVFRCVKQHKKELAPLCRNAVTQRLMESSEDIALDPDLNAACSQHRAMLCTDSGWGEGAAQACLESYLDPKYYSRRKRAAIDPVAGNTTAAGAAAASEGRLPNGTASAFQVSQTQVEAVDGPLSKQCRRALFQRQLDESEDIRFNFRLASACVLDKRSFCRDVKPGRHDVAACLEVHSRDRGFSAGCRTALEEQLLLRAQDVRLDHALVLACSADARSLCRKEVSDALVAGAELPPGEGNAALECLRDALHSDLLRSPACKSHVFRVVAEGYRDSRMDGVLQATCGGQINLLCRDHRSALGCLKEQSYKGRVSDDSCAELVQKRTHAAASDISFIPLLNDACASERSQYCGERSMQGQDVIDCLADHRHESDFGSECKAGLTAHLLEAVRDVRMMSSLRADCADDIESLCKGVQPGEGRVMTCLRTRRAEISGDLCKRQMLRLMGFIVEDYRLDFNLMQACKSDVQQYCGGVEPGNGQVHDCLRRSTEHLSPACREAEAEVERMEHEDVRLNPKIMRACPVAISSFCRAVRPGGAEVLSCLNKNMHQSDFPFGCKAVLYKLQSRAAAKYSLNHKLNQVCSADVAKLCKHAKDEREAMADFTVLGCLAGNATELSQPCLAELTALVHGEFRRYRVATPLTAACDGDVMTHCSVDKLTASYLEAGYVQSCLVRHAKSLHKPCWALISMMDDRQFKHAAEMENEHWAGRGGGGPGGEASRGSLDEHIAKVAQEVRREVEPKLHHLLDKAVTNVHDSVNKTMHAQVRAQHEALKPHINALLNTTALLVMLILLGGAVAIYFVRTRRLTVMGRSGAPLVLKDGRV